MEMPPWHVGHVIRKLMEARDPELGRTELAQRAKLRPMTVTNLLRGGRHDEGTLRKVCDVLDVSPGAVQIEVERSNAGRVGSPLAINNLIHRRRDADRDEATREAEMTARRMLRLPSHAQSAIHLIIRAFEEAYQMVARRSDTS